LVKTGGVRQARLVVLAGVAGIAALSLAVVARAAPVNDSFSNATAISGTTGTWSGTTSGATRESGEPIDANGGGHTVWYRWTPSVSGSVSFDTRGSAFDTILSIYTGTRARSLTLVARNDNAIEWNDEGSSRITFAASAGVTYRIQIDGRYGAVGAYSLTLNRPAPANDAFAAAQSVTGATGTVSGSLLLATRETSEPTHRGVSVGNSVWYRWTAPASGVYRFDTYASDNTVVAAYTGSPVSALLPAGTDCTSYDYRCIELAVTAGQVYSIAVDGTSSPHYGIVSLHWTGVPSPPNDAFANAQALSDTGGTVSGTTVGATREAGEPGSAQRTVWYRFAPRWSGEWLTDSSTVTNQFVQLFRGTSLTSLTSADFEALVAGTTYWLRVDGGAYPASFSFRLWKGPPANDNRGSEEWLGATWTQSTAGATKEPGEQNHAGNAGGASVWFYWSTGTAGTLTIDTIGSDYNTLLAVYSGGIALASDDDSGGNGTSRVSFHLDGASGWVYVAVDGFNGATGNLVLHSAFREDPPPNDGFASSSWISGDQGSVTTRTTGATRETGEPNHAGNAGGHSVWYRWTAPADGLAHLDTLDAPYGSYGPQFDTLLAVYTGTSIGALSLVAAEDPRWFASRATFPVSAGTVYRIAVDGKDGASGTFVLNWRVSPPNDDYATADSIAGTSGSRSATTKLATFEPWDVGTGLRDENGNVWYRWVAPAAEDVAFSATDSTGVGVVQVVTGATIDTAVGVAGATWDAASGETRFHAQAGAVYRVSVTADDFGTFMLRWGPTTLPPGPPANDAFAAPQTITGASGSLVEDVSRATIEPLEPEHDSLDDEPGYGSVWFRWTAPFTGQVTFDTAGSDFDPVVAVYGGTTLSSAVPVVANTDQLSQRGTFVRVGVTAGDTLRIVVARGLCCYPATQLSLAWRDSTTTAPSNDNLAAAQTLAGASGSVPVAIGGGSRQLGEPFHAGKLGGASVWYRWTAPATGPVAFMTQGTADTVLAAYRAGVDGSLTLVRDNWNAYAPYTSRIAYTATAGVTYLVAVDTVGAHRYHLAPGGSADLLWRQPPSPPNDAFANATLVNPSGWFSSAWITGDNLGATKEPGEPAHAGNAGGASVWYRVHYDSSWAQTYAVSTVGSSFDTTLAVYVGTSVGALTAAASDDDSGGGGASQLQFTAQAGVRDYWIAVDGKNGATGDLVLKLSPSFAPRNDDFGAASLLTGASGSVTGDVRNSSVETDELLPANDWPRDGTVWYRWTAPASGTWRFHSTLGAVGIWQGSLVRSLVEVGDSGWGRDADAAVVAGATYFVQVAADWRYGGVPTAFTLSWRQSVAPANDRFDAPLALTGNTGTITQSNAEASIEPGEPLHAGAPGGVSLWYTFTAPADGTLALDTFGSSFDTVLAAYTGNTLWALQESAASDDFAGSNRSALRFAVTAGTTYRVAVDDALFYEGAIPANTVALAWTFAPPPANDAFASSVTLSGASGSVTGTTVGARSEAGEPPHGERASAASVWYAWTSPATANVAFSLGADGFVAVYRGDAVGALSVVRRSDDAGPGSRSATVAVEAGVTYRIAVDGVAGAAGPFTLSWTAAVPPNDGFASASSLAGRSGTTLAATVGASKETGEPAHAGDAGGASVWYRWTARQSEVMGFDTLGSSFDTLLAVYTGTGLGSLTQIGASNDAAGVRTSALRVPVTDGVTYWIAVDGVAGATGNAVLDWFPSPAPANDDRSAAELIGGRQGSVSGSTIGALDSTVWYAWRAPGAGPVTFQLGPWSAPQTIAVYRGSTRLAGTTVTAVADETLHVAVSGSGGFQLVWAQPPPNDRFADAQTISGESGSVTGTTEGAQLESGEPDPGNGGSVWYRWAPAVSGTYVFGTDGSAARTNATVGIGSSAGAVRYAGTRLGATAGTTYVIRVVPDAWGSAGPIVLTWRRDASVPDNDRFAASHVISGTSGTLTQSFEGAAREVDEPSLTDTGNQTLWYRWTAPAGGRLSVDTRGTNLDSSVGIFTGTTLASLTRVAEGWGWAGGGGGSTIFYGLANLDVVAGATYFVQVNSDYADSAQVTWRLDTQNGTPASGANDMFGNAFAVTGPSGQASGSNVGATKEAGEPNHAGNAGGHSVWWTWTAPASGPTAITTEQASIDTLLAVYTGASVSALTLVGANDDDGSTGGHSSVSFSAVQGTTYRIAVDGKNGVTGPVAIRWTGQAADTVAPSTTIDSSPTGTTSSTTAVFTFYSSEVGARFECRLDSGAWFACSSPASYTGLAAGVHSFSVRSIDASGNVEQLPPARTWTIATTPGNDAFAAATPLSGLAGTVTDSTAGATSETGEPVHASGARGASVWYRWTPTRDGTLTLAATSSDFAPVAVLYTGSAVNALTAVTPAGGRFVVHAGTAYAIAVDGSGAGIFRLGWSNSPTNDDQARASTLVGASGSWRGDNIGATKVAGEPNHGGDPGGASVWLAWSAPSTGWLSVDTLGSEAGLDTLLAVYAVRSPTGIELQAQDNDSGGAGKSVVRLKVFEGTQYLVAVDGFRGATGQLGMTWSLAGASASTPPTVSFTAPADGARVSGPVVLEATAADSDGLDRVEFVVDGNTVGYDRDAPYSVTWSSTTVMDGAHTVTARAVDTTGATTTAPGRTITVDNTPPWVTIDSGPYAYGPVTATDATFTFHSEPNATFECGLDGAALAACTSPKNYTGLSVGAHRFEVRALDTAGVAGPIQSWSWEIASPSPGDTTPPDTVIQSGPTGTTTDTTATFQFVATESASFSCRLDTGTWTACVSPQSYAGLASGTHTFEVRATDSAGNVDATPASQSWTVGVPADPGSPDTTVTAGPTGSTTATSASFEFTASVTGSTFECRLDGAAFAACTSPKDYSGLATGTHTFEVRATDGAGNVDASPATRTWTISAPADTTPPDTTISSGPSGTVTATTASFAFGATETATFQCRLDGAAFAACTSPKDYSGLASGSHTFEVRATDTAGNVDPTPATRTWSVSAPTTSNDNFVNATSITGATGSTTGSTVGMTKETGEPNHGGNSGGHSIWFSWVAPGAGSVTVNTTGSAFDTLLAVYTGASVTALTTIASNDDANGTTQSSVSFNAVSGTTYRIAVDGYGGATGAVKLAWSQGAAASGPANDNFTSATVLSGPGSGTTVGATKEAGEPNHAGNAGGKSIWWSWTAPAAGGTTITTAGSTYDTLLAVYTGSALGALTTIGSNDDANGTTQSQVAFTAVAGTTYRIAVDGYGGASGSVAIRVSQP
jgi:hypothetical protein